MFLSHSQFSPGSSRRLHLPQLTLGPVNKAELDVQGFADRAAHKPPLSRKTPADSFRAVLRAKLGNMVVRIANNWEKYLS